MSFHNQPHAGPAGAPPNMAQSFNAMLQRSVHEPGQPELAPEGHGQPPSSVGKFKARRMTQRRNADATGQDTEAYTMLPHPHKQDRMSSAGDEDRPSRYSPSISHRKLS
jgi:hypothetical protein